MNPLVKRIVKNTGALLVARGIDILASVIMVGAISRYLGVEAFGEFGFVLSLVTFVVAFTYLGIERILIRNVARDESEAQKNFSTALTARWILSIIVIGIIFLLVLTLDLPRESKVAILITAISQLAFSSASLYAAVFKAYERMEYETVLTLGSQIIALGLVLWAIAMDLGFLAIFMAIGISNVGRLFASVLIVHIKFLKTSFSLDPKMTWEFLKDSIVLGANFLVVQALVRVDVLLLRALESPEEVSLYFAPHTLLVRIQVLPMALTTALLPFFSRMARKEADADAFAFGFRRAYQVLLACGGLLMIGCMLFASQVMTVIFGAEYAAATTPFQILLPSMVFIFLHPLLTFIVLTKDKHLLLIPASAAALMVNITLSFFLIPVYGAAGASLASTLGYTVLFGMALYFVNTRLIPISFSDTIIKPMGALAFVTLAVYFFTR